VVDFEWTEDQRRYRDEVADFALHELAPVLGTDAGEFPREAWKRCAAAGLLGIVVPTEWGGRGADPLTAALAMEALGAGCPDGGLLFSIGAQTWSCVVPISRFGRPDQKERYLPGLCDGSLVGCQAMTEPDSGSDAFALTTRAVPTDGGYVLNGAKTFITNAPVADLCVVFARTDPSKSWGGISTFIVDRDTPGFTVAGTIRKMGLESSPIGELTFSDCFVGDDALLGKPGAGMAIFNAAMEWERSLILAVALGIMQRHIDHCTSLVKSSSRDNDDPSGDAHTVVDMKVRLESARHLVYKAAWLLGRGKRSTLEAATAKLYVSECLVASTHDAIRLEGMGALAGSQLERDMRDAVGSRIYSGTSDMQRNVIARLMGL
jgi:hypothetical protein